MTRGDWHELESTWSSATAATSVGGALYLAASEAIYQVEPDGNYQVLGNDSWQSRLLIGVDGALLSLEPGGGLYRLDLATRKYRQLDGDWTGTIAATAHDGALYAIDGATMCRVSPHDGSYTEVAGGFASTRFLGSAGDALITIEDSGSMYRVSPADGTWERFDDRWGGTRAIAGDATSLYVVSGSTLYVVDPTDGSYAELTDTTWSSRLLAVAGGALYGVEPGGGLFRIELS